MNNNGASVVDYLLSVDIVMSFSCSTEFRYTQYINLMNGVTVQHSVFQYVVKTDQTILVIINMINTSVLIGNLLTKQKRQTQYLLYSL